MLRISLLRQAVAAGQRLEYSVQNMKTIGHAFAQVPRPGEVAGIVCTAVFSREDTMCWL